MTISQERQTSFEQLKAFYLSLPLIYIEGTPTILTTPQSRHTTYTHLQLFVATCPSHLDLPSCCMVGAPCLYPPSPLYRRHPNYTQPPSIVGPPPIFSAQLYSRYHFCTQPYLLHNRHLRHNSAPIV